MAWEGGPHPLSPPEILLAEALAQDEELKGLFRLNATVEALGSALQVDLWWPAGGLAVEIDGYAYHSGYKAFARDRHRDYLMLAAGRRVLRLTGQEVLSDAASALGKIRRVVAAISGAPGAAPASPGER
jgi:very-short-patch-repair endonuclease